MTLRHPLPMDWQHELETIESLSDDELVERLDKLTDDELIARLAEIDRMATLAGVATAYVEPFPPVPWWHHALVMLLVPTIGVCAVGIMYAWLG